MSALSIDYISARGSRMVISPVGSRDKLELKLRQVRALQGPMIEGEFYNRCRRRIRHRGKGSLSKGPSCRRDLGGPAKLNRFRKRV